MQYKNQQKRKAFARAGVNSTNSTEQPIPLWIKLVLLITFGIIITFAVYFGI